MDNKKESNQCQIQEAESKERLKTITNNELKAKMKINFGKILDVRTKEDFEKNHIEGAISIPLEELEDNLDKFDKKEDISIICNTGVRTKKAGKILEDNGFTMVTLVLPGMSKW